MTGTELLTEAFDRIQTIVDSVLDDLPAEALQWRAGAEANPIGWLVWHLTRVQDDHLAQAAGHDQQWTTGGWSARFDLGVDDDAIGYGMSPDEVGALRFTSTGLLGDYHHAVRDATTTWVSGLTEAHLDQVVDDSYDPPVTLGARLVSVVSDDLQHAGQAAYVRGLAERAGVVDADHSDAGS